MQAKQGTKRAGGASVIGGAAMAGGLVGIAAGALVIGERLERFH